jgi:hypothetical protein
MTIVAYSGEQPYRAYLNGRIRDAKATLDKLPILKTLTDEFNSLLTSRRIDNVIFWKCAWAESGINRQPDIGALAEVTKIEEWLRQLDVLQWPRAKKDAIVAKIQSNTIEMSLAGYTEITVAGRLADKFGVSSIEYEPALSQGRFGDVKLDLDGRLIYFEITALNARETERKFSEIFTQLAEYIWARVNRGLCIHIEIDTGVLPVSEGAIDVAASVGLITDFITASNLVSIFVDGFSLHGLKYFSQLDAAQSLYDQKLMLQHYSTELFEKIETEPFRSFATSVTPRAFVNCPVVYFWCVPGKNGVVEVAEQEIFPSAVASLEHQAFLRHVVRKLKEELNQLESGEVNIIVLRASNWSLSGFERGKIEEEFVYGALQSTIQKFMRDSVVQDLSAVVVYEDEFAKAQIVVNPNVSERSRVTYEFIEKMIR